MEPHRLYEHGYHGTKRDQTGIQFRPSFRTGRIRQVAVISTFGFPTGLFHHSETVPHHVDENPRASLRANGPIQLLETSSMKLRRLVEGIEMSSDFGSLVALVWFLNYVDHVLHETRHDSALPTREELLSVLDLKSERRERVKHLLKIL